MTSLLREFHILNIFHSHHLNNRKMQPNRFDLEYNKSILLFCCGQGSHSTLVKISEHASIAANNKIRRYYFHNRITDGTKIAFCERCIAGKMNCFFFFLPVFSPSFHFLSFRYHYFPNNVDVTYHLQLI